MQRYRFTIYNSTGVTEDEEGHELPDAEAAHAEALNGIRSILAEEVRKGRLDLRGRVDVSDDRGRILFSVSYAEAVDIHYPIDDRTPAE